MLGSDLCELGGQLLDFVRLTVCARGFMADKEGVRAALEEEEEEGDEVELAYQAPEKKSLQEIQQLDKDDESLTKYKQALLGPVPEVVDPSLPGVQVIRLTLVCEEAPGPITMDLAGDLEALKNQAFVLKEGVDYRVKISFKVNKEIVCGLKYLHHTYRKGLRDAPGCRHCQALAPEFSKAAALLKNVSSELRLAKVDGVVEKELSEEFAVGGFPALKLFKLGNRSDPVDYLGRREAGAIVRWLLRKAGPSTTLLEDEAAATRFIDSQDPVVVLGFFSDLQGDNAAVVTTIAEDAVDFSFGLTDRPELFQKYGVSRDTVVLFKKFDEGRVDFPVDGDLDLEEFSHFLLMHSLELVMEFNSQTSSKIFEAKVLNHLLLFVNQTLEAHRALRPAFYEAAAPFRGQVLFVVVDVAGDNDHVLQYFGLNATAVPTLRFINVETTRKYMPQPGPVTAASVTAFCQDVLGGKIKPYLKSQEIPPDWDQRPVKVLVGKNFEQVAFDETKNVFVKFYAPWCTHCREMAPAWEELADKYREQEDILIAELDSTANELEDFTISGFPTLKYFPAGPGRKVEVRARVRGGQREA
uniref:protein disulfide-isomerase n=1 Tax=Ornithorhynchus anatinus TaxID=9258 RepID=A0A6I8NN86_ORNAN